MTAVIILDYGNGDEVEIENVAAIYVDDGDRFYVQTKDGFGNIFPPPLSVEVHLKAGKSPFTR